MGSATQLLESFFC